MFDGQHCHEGCVRNRTELAQCVESDKEFHTECPGRVGFVKVPDWARRLLPSSPVTNLVRHNDVVPLEHPNASTARHSKPRPPTAVGQFHVISTKIPHLESSACDWNSGWPTVCWHACARTLLGATTTATTSHWATTSMMRRWCKLSTRWKRAKRSDGPCLLLRAPTQGPKREAQFQGERNHATTTTQPRTQPRNHQNRARPHAP